MKLMPNVIHSYIKCRVWLKLFVGIFLLLPSLVVFAHAQYERSDPGRRSIVIRSPEVVKIWFTEQLEPAYSKIVVKGVNGNSVTEAKATIDADNGKLLILKMPLLTSGKYTVFYKVLSIDGHVVNSKFNFKVKLPKQTP